MRLDTDPDLLKYFKVRPADSDWRRVISKRRNPVRPIPGMDNDDVQVMREGLYPLAGLEEYLQTWSGEMKSRPIPFVSTDSKPLDTQKLYDKYMPEILRFLLPYVKPGVQTINKISRLGYPVFGNPGDGIDRKSNSPTYGFKTQRSKFDEWLILAKPIYYGDIELYRNGVHTEGNRTQNDPPDKSRDQQFIDDTGTPYAHETTPHDRIGVVPDLGELILSRSRIITQAPACNNATQCWDTLLNNVLGQFHLFDADVYSDQSWRYEGQLVTFDCKHYERYTGLCALSYADLIGGNFGTLLRWMINYPVVVPSDSWRSFWEIQPIFGPGSYPQFYSGLSPVADNNKLVNVAVQVAFFHEHIGLSITEAIAETLSGVGHGMRRWNFGDDNRAVGEPGVIKAWLEWMKTYFAIDIDEIPTYLGTIFRADLKKWCLPRRTYLLKMFQPERDFSWKEFPNMGLVLRRETFLRYGEPEIGSELVPIEDRLLTEVGLPWVDIVNKGHAEMRNAKAVRVQFDKYVAADKEYLMTEQQKIASGMYWHLSAEQTASMAISLVGKEIKERLSFAHMQLTPPPEPDSLSDVRRTTNYAGSLHSNGEDTTDEYEEAA